MVNITVGAVGRSRGEAYLDGGGGAALRVRGSRGARGGGGTGGVRGVWDARALARAGDPRARARSSRRGRGMTGARTARARDDDASARGRRVARLPSRSRGRAVERARGDAFAPRSVLAGGGFRVAPIGPGGRGNAGGFRFDPRSIRLEKRASTGRVPRGRGRTRAGFAAARRAPVKVEAESMAAMMAAMTCECVRACECGRGRTRV